MTSNLYQFCFVCYHSLLNKQMQTTKYQNFKNEKEGTLSH